MTKRCWNCGEYHQNSASYCRFCGASLGSENVFVQGVKGIYDFVDDKTHLSRRQLAAVAVIVVVIAAVAAVVLSDYSREEDPIQTADCRYNYKVYFENPLPTETEGEYLYPNEGFQFVVVKLAMVNDKARAIYNGSLDWRVIIFDGDERYQMNYDTTLRYIDHQPLVCLNPGESGHQCVVYMIKDTITDLDSLTETVEYLNAATIELDPSIEV